MKKNIIVVLLVLVCAGITCSAALAADDSWDRVKRRGNHHRIDDAFPAHGVRNEKNELVASTSTHPRRWGKGWAKGGAHPHGVGHGDPVPEASKFDIVWFRHVDHAEREKEIAFTKPYIMEKQVVVVEGGQQEDPIPQGPGRGHCGGRAAGSTPEGALGEAQRKFKEIKKYDKNTDAFMDLSIGRIGTRSPWTSWWEGTTCPRGPQVHGAQGGAHLGGP
jgi:polar amino acid transport system substrate-binding protein